MSKFQDLIAAAEKDLVDNPTYFDEARQQSLPNGCYSAASRVVEAQVTTNEVIVALIAELLAEGVEVDEFDLIPEGPTLVSLLQDLIAIAVSSRMSES